MYSGSSKIREWCSSAKIIPVLSIPRLEHAVPLATALAAGGIRVVEITLRSQCAAKAIAQVREQVPELIVAAGTVLDQSDVITAKEHGAHFAFSPGSTLRLMDVAYDVSLPIMPGVATASEAMEWGEYGIDAFKFFPAEQMGGVATLKAFYAPMPKVHFCPTGGVSTANARQYLDLPNVLCVGGSWLVCEQHYANQNWAEVTELAQRAMALLGP